MIEKKLPSLVKMPPSSSKYKLVIPKKVEDKIRYLQCKFPNTEWSGVLFYTYEGSFETELTFTCQDIYPMDLGNATFTEFRMSEDISSYVAQNMEELWDCKIGLVHSHHSMNTFFSGTDTATLQSEGADMNNFVSLIVNNAGTYSAAVTRKVTISTQKQATNSYKEWDKNEDVIFKSTSSEQKEVIEYFMLEIEKENTSSYPEIDERFEEIQKRKQEEAKQLDAIQKTNEKMPKQLNLFSSPFNEEEEATPNFNVQSQNNFEIDDKEVYNTIAKMLLCSLIIDASKIDLEKWINTNMVSLYNKVFESPESQKFRDYLDFIVPYSIDYFKGSEQFPLDIDVENCITFALKSTLVEMQPINNPYYEEFIKSLNVYTELYE